MLDHAQETGSLFAIYVAGDVGRIVSFSLKRSVIQTTGGHLCLIEFAILEADALCTSLTGRLLTVTVSAESIDYEGVNLKGRHVVIVCDLVDEDSDYLKECIRLCKELKASHVVAVPLMLWNPELIDNLTEESIKAELSHENRPLS